MRWLLIDLGQDDLATRTSAQILAFEAAEGDPGEPEEAALRAAVAVFERDHGEGADRSDRRYLVVAVDRSLETLMRPEKP